jgi:hypothetical protein
MNMRRLTAAALFGLPFACAAAGLGPSDFRSLAEPAILYDAPSKQGKPLFVIQRHTPVEVVVNIDRWTKVREPAGSLLWVERRSSRQAHRHHHRRPRRHPPEARRHRAAGLRSRQGRRPRAHRQARRRLGQGQASGRQHGFIRINQIWGL